MSDRIEIGHDVPELPFEGFKWRWASNTPSEGLNKPEVYLGVLRALDKVRGQRPSSPQLFSELRAVETEVETAVSLARPAERNLIRNSGQYWRALGTLTSTSPITLSTLGERYARRAITPREFAISVVNNFALPSTSYSDDEAAAWNAHGLHIRPLRLILDILVELEALDSKANYLTQFELLKCVQPLSSVGAGAQSIASHILAARSGIINLATWPEVALESNDRRMSKEFLQFLDEYGLVIRETVQTDDGLEARYYLDDAGNEADAAGTPAPHVVSTGGMQVPAPVEIERRRVLRSLLNRPGQARFRRDVLNSASSLCVLSGTTIRGVLEAAHIQPVAARGSDSPANGLCLRTDLHRLFDAQHIRIESTGRVHYSPALAADSYYSSLPKRIIVPAYVSLDALDWRWKYT